MTTSEVLCQGKALVTAIEGLQALDRAGVEIGQAERDMPQALLKQYQARLREIIASVSAEAAGEILLAMKSAAGMPLYGANAN